MSRRERRPDTRLDWCDPKMPVLRPWEDWSGERYLKEISPEEESAHCAEMVNNKNPNAPKWMYDPTYNLAKRKRRR